MNRHRLLAAIIMLLCAFAACAYADEADSERPQLIYFFENYCDACHPEVDFITEFYELTGHNVDEYAYTWYNIRNNAARESYYAAVEQYEIPVEKQFLPMAIVDGVVYAGNSTLKSALPLDFIENTSTDSLIYYIYAPSCEGCITVKALLDEQPATLEVQRGNVTFDSTLVVLSINIYEELPLAKALFEAWSIPEDDQTTPMIILRDEYINGAELISARLPYMLRQGKAVGTPLIEAAEGSDTGASTLTIAGTAIAGFVAGFNPCALSMLLLFLSILISSGRNAARYSAVYLTAKFVTYMAIGTVFFTVLSAWNPTFLPLLARILLTVMGGALIILNLMDAWSAHKEKYGDIKNQLPRRIRGYLNDRIKRSLQRHGKALALSVVVLGVVVAASEFLCSGQLYLATITAGISSGIGFGRQFGLLFIFCVAFLLPSAVITVIVVRTRDMFAASDSLLRRMPLIKLCTAIVMAAIIIVAWVM